MPVNAGYGVERVMDACRRYFETTGRRVSFEYAMINEVNDSAEHAQKLAELLRHGAWHVNLILLNNVEERSLAPSGRERVARFTKILERGGVNFTLRRRLGADIDAACGQLRRREAASG
jgi:23S rRNA (adenine2503-C2)-methyltransferase